MSFTLAFMRNLIVAGALFGAAASPASGQTACPSSNLAKAASEVTTIRQQLHRVAVPAGSPLVPAEVAAQLTALQDALARAAAEAFRCAGHSASAEALQQLLGTALRANLAPGTDQVTEDRNKRDRGAYGADLTVHVFALSDTPRLLEVSFRYGLECGDDNLLLLFRAADDTAYHGWHLDLRYGAHPLKTVGDALGDFILLSPVTGDAKDPVWRYVVAHGHPACGETPRPSTFTLELLTPTTDASRPERTWEFTQAYVLGAAMPRLETTEDTIDLRLMPMPRRGRTAEAAAPRSGASGIADAPSSEVYRFHVTSEGKVDAVPAGASAGSTARP